LKTHLIETPYGRKTPKLLCKAMDAHVNEACCQFPAEDFLEGVKDRLHELSKRVRGDNKSELMGIIEALDDIAQCTFNAADYGRDELRKAIKALDEVRE
jgi:hypothetical protein